MDKRRGILNVGTSIASKVILLVSSLVVRRLLIRHIGNDANGLNSLYASIIGMLSVAEAGIGSAIAFSMYKPIVDGDERTVTALYRLYRTLYRIIGAFILVAGLAVVPFLPRLIGDYGDLSIDIYAPYILTLSTTFVSYLYSAKTSLIQAYKDDYVVTEIVTAAGIVRSILQIAAILVFRSYIAYLICNMVETLLIWYLTERAVRSRHQAVIEGDAVLEKETRREVTKNIKAMFMHKIGTVLVLGVDSVVISAFIGVAVLGKYSNYTTIKSSMIGLISLFFTPLTSVIGHMCASESKESIRRYFSYFFSLNFVLGVVFCLGYYAVIDEVIGLIFGAGLELSRTVTFVVALEGFIGFMRKVPLLFRTSAGAFYYDRWKPFFEGIANLVLSVSLVKVLPEETSVAGVVLSTVITEILICDIVEPHVLFKYVFGYPATGHYLRNYLYIVVFAGGLVAMDQLRGGGLIRNGLISLALSAAILTLTWLADRSFRRDVSRMAREVSSRLRPR